MALANFFAKSAMGMAQIIQGCTPDFLAARLSSQVVAITFDGDAAGSAEGRCSLSLLVSLLSRFYPKLAIVDLSGRCAGEVQLLASQALAINPEIEIQERTEGVTVMVVVGGTQASAPALLYVG